MSWWASEQNVGWVGDWIRLRLLWLLQHNEMKSENRTLHFCVFVFVFTSELERHSHWSKSRDKSWDGSRRLQWPEGSTSRSSSLHTQTQTNRVGREKKNFLEFNFKMQVVTQWRASKQLCSSTIVTSDATNNIQVSTQPPAPITRQPPHLDDENI